MAEVLNNSPFDCNVDVVNGTCPEEVGHSFRVSLPNNKRFSLDDLACPEHKASAPDLSVIHGKSRESQEGCVISALPLKHQHP